MGDGRFSKWHRGYPSEGLRDGLLGRRKKIRDKNKQKNKIFINYQTEFSTYSHPHFPAKLFPCSIIP